MDLYLRIIQIFNIISTIIVIIKSNYALFVSRY